MKKFITTHKKKLITISLVLATLFTMYESAATTKVSNESCNEIVLDLMRKPSANNFGALFDNEPDKIRCFTRINNFEDATAGLGPSVEVIVRYNIMDKETERGCSLGCNSRRKTINSNDKRRI
jgi:hypothetical protein